MVSKYNDSTFAQTEFLTAPHVEVLASAETQVTRLLKEKFLVDCACVFTDILNITVFYSTTHKQLNFSLPMAFQALIVFCMTTP